MQYNVPQFVDIEDKIIGPFTIKQFLALLAGAIFVLLFWMVFEFTLFFWVLSLPVAAVALFFAIGQFNGKTMLAMILPAISYLVLPKRRIFNRTDQGFELSKAVPPPKVAPAAPPDENVHSRLKRLSYVLDQKSTEEAELKDKANQFNTSDRG